MDFVKPIDFGMRRDFPENEIFSEDPFKITERIMVKMAENFDRRFRMEDQGLVPMDRTFRWKMLDKPPKFRPWNFEQISLF